MAHFKPTMGDDATEFMPTRWTLIERLRIWDDQESWKDFFDIYWRLIYSMAIKAGCTPDEAQEVVQETVISVSKQMKTFKPDPAAGSFKGWLLAITRHRIIDRLRKRPAPGQMISLDHALGPDTTARGEGMDVATVPMEVYWEQQWTDNLLTTALGRVKEKVSPKQYQIFHLASIKKLATREVAETLNVSSTQVYIAKHRVALLVKQEVRRLERRQH